jgi:hypothetical protein
MFKNSFSKLFLTAIVITAALVTLSFAAKFSTPSVDRAYDAVEQVRAQRSTGNSLVTDNSYDLIEGLRLARSANAPAADRSYDLIESVRAQRTN